MQEGANKRITLEVPAELMQEISEIKQEAYWDKPMSKLARDLIALGVQEYQRSKAKA